MNGNDFIEFEEANEHLEGDRTWRDYDGVQPEEEAEETRRPIYTTTTSLGEFENMFVSQPLKNAEENLKEANKILDEISSKYFSE